MMAFPEKRQEIQVSYGKKRLILTQKTFSGECEF